MTMNVEALQTIELDATRAPAQMVDHYIQLVRNSRIEQVPTRLRLHQPERGALPPVGVAAPFSHNKKGNVTWQLARRNIRPRASSVAA
ncbi:MAG: hypothetical protein IPJ08_08200 [Burkholderiales bacterium]|nr:hypothetical protein [Burkholderiales bacterium]